MAVGQNALANNTTASNNIAIGLEALFTNTTGAQCIAIGGGAAAASNISNTLAIGYSSLNDLTTGARNVAIGNYTLDTTQSGSNSVAVGYAAGDAVTTAINLVLVGDVAGDAITTSSGCVFIGQAAGSTHATGSSNVYIGAQAGADSTNGSNVAVGGSAAGSLTTGYNNTFIGHDAGDSATTGYNNVIVGINGNLQAVDSNNEIILGYDLSGIAANYFVFGKGNGVDRVYNQFTSNASWTRASDERYKKEIKDNTDCGLAFINDLRPVTFKWKARAELDKSLPDYDADLTEAEHPEKLYGLIAQEVKATLDKHNITDFGGWSETKNDKIQGISQEMFIHPLIKAVQELSAEVTTLKSEIAALKGG